MAVINCLNSEDLFVSLGRHELLSELRDLTYRVSEPSKPTSVGASNYLQVDWRFARNIEENIHLFEDRDLSLWVRGQKYASRWHGSIGHFRKVNSSLLAFIQFRHREEVLHCQKFSCCNHDRFCASCGFIEGEKRFRKYFGAYKANQTYLITFGVDNCPISDHQAILDRLNICQAACKYLKEEGFLTGGFRREEIAPISYRQGLCYPHLHVIAEIPPWVSPQEISRSLPEGVSIHFKHIPNERAFREMFRYTSKAVFLGKVYESEASSNPHEMELVNRGLQSFVESLSLFYSNNRRVSGNFGSYREASLWTNRVEPQDWQLLAEPTPKPPKPIPNQFLLPNPQLLYASSWNGDLCETFNGFKGGFGPPEHPQ